MSNRMYNYITYSMALAALGTSSKQNMRLYRAVEEEDANIRVVKVGRMRLLCKSDFLKVFEGDSPNGEKLRWPVHIAVLDVDNLMTADEAAQELGVSQRTIYTMAERNEIIYYDLSHWGGQRLFNRGSVISEKLQRGLRERALKLKRTPKYLTRRKNGRGNNS